MMNPLSSVKFGHIYKIKGLKPENTQRFMEKAVSFREGAFLIEANSVPYLVTGDEAKDYEALKRALKESPLDVFTQQDSYNKVIVGVVNNLEPSFIEGHQGSIKELDLNPNRLKD